MARIGIPLLFVLGLAPLTLQSPALARGDHRFSVEILVDGSPLAELPARGKTYVEALRGREYSIRLTNHTSRRAAVALSVDGVNTIDASSGSPHNAPKWVVPAYGSVVIDGWQTDSATARRFFFTHEERAYATWLGKTRDLGLVSAAFFLERVPDAAITQRRRYDERKMKDEAAPSAGARDQRAEAQSGAGAQAPAAESDYAATGSGAAVEHVVHSVDLQLERGPAAVLDLRYEYRDALVRLGVLPRDVFPPDALARRERAEGYGRFCPAPPR